MYYPKSQIKSNLYTSGNEYIVKSSGEPYSGFYYKTSIGKKYTGKTPEDGGNYELIPPPNYPTTDSYAGNILRVALFPSDPDPTVPPGQYIGRTVLKYTNFKPKSNIEDRIVPSYNSPKPTEKDYEIGEYQRYFCKKTNELLYLEINKDTYKKLSSSDPKIASDLYNAISTPWTITGDKQSTFNTNKNIITLIERNQKWYGFTSYFRDRFLQYHISEQNENLYTSGGEYTLPDGVVYIGFYHIMSNGNAMTGKEHGTGGDIILKQISSKIPSPVTQTTTSPQVPSRGGGY